MASASQTNVKTNGKANPTTDDLADQVSQIKEELANMTKLLADYGWSKEKKLEGAVRDRVATAKAKGQDAVDTARLHAMTAGDEAQEFVRRQPATALGIAAGVGFVIGMMSQRR